LPSNFRFGLPANFHNLSLSQPTKLESQKIAKVDFWDRIIFHDL